MKKQVLVTGGCGTIGNIIFEALSNVFSLTFLDIKWPHLYNQMVSYIDVAHNYEFLKSAMKGKDVVIHLAWDNRENWKSHVIVPENKLMAENVYMVAIETGVRVIMASSIHADNFLDWRGFGSRLMSPYKTPEPKSFYGVTKTYIETLGRCCAKRDLEVVCIRFGGVSFDDKFRKEDNYQKIWLSKRDCADLIRSCIDAKYIPHRFCLLYGVSNNADRIHDWSNPLGWTPVDDSSKILLGKK